MGMFDKLIANLKSSKKTIVFTEGNPDEVKAAAANGGFNIDGAEIIDPATYPEMESLVAQMVELRKGKMTEDECRAALSKSNYFGTMLVKAGKADALLGGATYSTADTVRPALQIIKTKKGSNLVSSSFILFREKDGQEEKIAMGDCAINLAYTDRVDKEGNVVYESGFGFLGPRLECIFHLLSRNLDFKMANCDMRTCSADRNKRDLSVGG